MRGYFTEKNYFFIPRVIGVQLKVTVGCVSECSYTGSSID